MNKCKHQRITTFIFPDGTTAGMWACVECKMKFVPISESMALQAKIDELMQEYCPEDMTNEQWATYAEQQERAKDDLPACP